MLREAVLVPGILAVLSAVFPAHMGPVFINGTFVVRCQKMTLGVDHDVPILAINI
jgi:hypothetical protein